MSYRHPLAASGFSASGASGLYEKVRPTYPLAAVSRIVSCLPRGSQVVELGAGTGIFTRALLSNSPQGCITKLVAIEPAEGMRQGFERTMAEWRASRPECEGGDTGPEVMCSDGSFDNIGAIVPSCSADLVAAAQAWHWTGEDPSVQERCMKEVARVLKMHGCFALIWNLKDREAADWVGDVRDAYEVFEAGTPQYRLGLWKHMFHTPTFRSSFRLLPPSDHQELDNGGFQKAKNVDDSIDKSKPTLTAKHMIPTSFQGLYERILSKSFMTGLEDETKQKLKTKLASIWDNQVKGNPSVKWLDENTIEFPYVAHLYVLQKIDQQ